MSNKPKLSFSDLYDKLLNKGITQGSFTKEEILDILTTKNYYYRLASYRKNFNKQNNKYIDLNFDALLDMSSIDTYIREYLFHICLDIEHLAKTRLMTHITNNNNEDGYTLVQEFEQRYPDLFNNIRIQFQNNRYKKDMFNKRSMYSIWVFLEIIDFGTLIRFIEMYVSNNPHFKSIVNPQSLKFVKNIRNACAHNDVFFINLFHTSNRLPTSNQMVVSFANIVGINRNYVRYFKINDIVTCHFIHKKLSTMALRTRRFEEGIQVLSRMTKNQHLYRSSTDYQKFLNIIQTCVDYLLK